MSPRFDTRQTRSGHPFAAPYPSWREPGLPRAIGVFINGQLNNHAMESIMKPILRTSRNLVMALGTAAAISLAPAPFMPAVASLPVIDVASLTQAIQSVMQGAQMLNQQVMLVQQNVQNLTQLPTSTLKNILPSVDAGTLVSLQQLSTSVNSLMQSSQDVQKLYGRAHYEMDALQMTPAEWTQAYMELAHTRGGIYRQQLDQDIATMNSFASRAQALRTLSDQIPGIAGNVSGLQLLNQQASAQAGELMQINAVLTRQAMLDTQDKQAKADSDARWAEASIAQMRLAEENATQRRNGLKDVPQLRFFK